MYYFACCGFMAGNFNIYPLYIHIHMYANSFLIIGSVTRWTFQDQSASFKESGFTLLVTKKQQFCQNWTTALKASLDSRLALERWGSTWGGDLCLASPLAPVVNLACKDCTFTFLVFFERASPSSQVLFMDYFQDRQR